MCRILNLTQHPASEPQQDEGVFEPRDKKEVQNLLTFNDLPTKEAIEESAQKLAAIAAESGAEAAMIGGAPFLMCPLVECLEDAGVSPLFAFSKRESQETILADGTVKKTAVFRHLGFC